MSAATPSTEVIVGARFCGPPGLGNGGYACGTFASQIGSPAAVSLRKPVPLDSPLRLIHTAEGSAVEDASGELIAEVASVGPLDGIEPPRRPGIEEADEASRRSPFRTERHAYPGCFVCGPEHRRGLHIHVGELGGDPLAFADSFTVGVDLADEEGVVRPPVVWAMLDCPSFVPSYWEGGPVLLGRLTAELLEPVAADRPLVAVSWPLGADGRKLHAASAVLDAEGRMLARAKALWIRLKKPTTVA